MLGLTPPFDVYLACGVTDMRNSIDGLALRVEKQFRLDPFSRSMFVFCNRKRNKLKILFWDKNGFWLFYRRLEGGHFRWPERKNKSPTVRITSTQLSWLLDGLTVDEKKAHREVLKRKLI